MKTKPATTEQMESAVQTLIETRDFCGNEAEALRDWQADEGIKLSTSEIMAIHRMVATVWEMHQRDAGVKFPLNSDERRHAYKVIERGL